MRFFDPEFILPAHAPSLAKTGTPIAIAFLFLAGCATTPSLDRAISRGKSFCSEPPRAKKTFLLYSYVKTPAGLDASEAEAYVARVGAFGDVVANNLVRILANTALRSDQDGDAFIEKTHASISTFSDEGDKGGFRIAWLKDDKFISWDADYFNSLKLPNGKSIELNSGRCTAFAETFKENHGGTGCSTGFDQRSLPAYIAESGYNLGLYLLGHYFSVPERDQPKVCGAAGLVSDCYNFTEESYRAFKANLAGTPPPTVFSDGHTSHNQLDIDLQRSRSLSVLFPATDRTTGSPLDSNQLTRIEWFSSFSRDLILMAAVKVSKKIQGDWVISRIDFDPSLICKYSKPLSDFDTH